MSVIRLMSGNLPAHQPETLSILLRSSIRGSIFFGFYTALISNSHTKVCFISFKFSFKPEKHTVKNQNASEQFLILCFRF